MEGIILLAGQGTRTGLGYNKCFYKLGNKMVFLYSLELLKKYLDHITLVIREEEKEIIEPYLDEFVSYTVGGDMRYLSVMNGISKTSSEYVLIHDGARPFLTEDCLKELLKSYRDYDATLVVEAEKNTIYYYDERLKMIDRSKILIAKTPQIVKRQLYLEAFNERNDFSPTDDISLLLNYDKNLRVGFVYDDGTNFKITNKFDLTLGQMLVEGGNFND